MSHLQHRSKQAGFTLVELSIVLVIIGLIVGGVLAGQDMIKAAEIRATVSQAEKYNTATNTFRDKFGVTPGDAGASKAAQFGMPIPARAAATIATDQDGLLECNGTGCAVIGGTNFGSETSLFWRDLSWAVLISDSLQTTNGTVAGGVAGPITPGGAAGVNMSEFIPEAKIGRGNYFTAFSAAGKNFYQLAGITSITNGTGAYALANRLTPQEAFNIDQKMDDGKPTTGAVRSLSTIASAVALNAAVATIAVPANNTVAGAAPLGCVITGTLDYQTSTDDDKNTPACMLRMMFN